MTGSSNESFAISVSRASLCIKTKAGLSQIAGRCNITRTERRLQLGWSRKGSDICGIHYFRRVIIPLDGQYRIIVGNEAHLVGKKMTISKSKGEKKRSAKVKMRG